MKIHKFHSEYSAERNQNDWSLEVVADGRIWVVKGCSRVEGGHTIGQLRAKDNAGYGSHESSQLAKQVREFVLEEMERRFPAAPQETAPVVPEVPEVESVLSIETRAVVAEIIEDILYEIFNLEQLTVTDNPELTSLERTIKGALIDGFDKAINCALEAVETFNDEIGLENLVRKREHSEKQLMFYKTDLVLCSIREERGINQTRKLEEANV